MARSLLRFARLSGAVGRDERGVSMVEFGMIAPFFALLIGGMVDLSMGLAQRFTMQQALNRSLEMVQANRPHADADESTIDYDFLIQEVATAAGVAASKVTLTKTLECNGTKQASFDSSCAAGTDSARYIDLKVVKDFTGRMFVKTTVPITATASVRVQ